MEIKQNEERINILNIEGVKEFLYDLSFPVYFLDFEAITNTKEWMFSQGLPLDQQISSFSILKIESLNDDETKIKHYNFIGNKEDYPLMAKKLTDFYKDKKGSVVVWGRDLEIRALGKLIKKAPESLHKKLAFMISNIIDLQQLFYTGSFMKLEPSGKSSLDSISKAYGVYLETSIKNGKKAHFVLENSLKKDITISESKNINRIISEYNNSDVINIKRILIQILKEIKK